MSDYSTPLDVLLRDKGARAIQAVYEAHKSTVKFVGGCVRDALAGNKNVGDIDLATPTVPEEGLKWLEQAGITVKPTGLKYGTITAIIGKKPYEITTLRRDVKTDGRHAEVVYGTSWEDDAQRRDFTINGLSCDFAGNISDYVGGIDDLKEGHLRFIGDAATRCREDYVRILRLFRFWARFGKIEIDKATLAAVQDTADGLKDLSPQRVWMELKKTLSLPRVVEALGLMQTAHIMPYIFDENVFHLKQLEKFLALENAVPMSKESLEPSRESLRRLAVLHIQQNKGGWSLNWQDLSERFLLSGQETDHLSILNIFGEKPVYWLDRPTAALYNFEPHVLIDAYLLCAVMGHLSGDKLLQRLASVGHDKPPHMPVAASDLIQWGYSAGPELGLALSKIRQYWLDHDCRLTKEKCLRIL